MNFTSRANLLKTVTSLRRALCQYDALMHKKAPSFCDCKYGRVFVKGDTPGSFAMHEMTGCPELRCVEYLLQVLTDDEYKSLTERTQPSANFVAEPVPEAVMLFLNGRDKPSYRCECGCNVFTKKGVYKNSKIVQYECNSCGTLLEGEGT